MDDMDDSWSEDMPWLGQYILDEEGNAVPAKGLLSWAKWIEEHPRQLAEDQIGDATVSTVFLGLDYGAYMNINPLTYKPLLWESMIFGEQSRVVDRYTSKEDALAGHREIVQMLTSEMAASPDR